MLFRSTGCGPAVTKPVAVATNVPLSYGWKYACAITNAAIDLSDRGQAQKKIVLAYLAEGDTETARACAVQIEDWSKGMALAAIAESLVAHGERAKAEAMLPELETCGFTATDWQRDYLRSAIIRIQALLGRGNDVAHGAAKFNARSSLGGDVAANLALTLAKTGRVDEATGILDNLAKTNGIDTADASVRGYLDLVVSGQINPDIATQMMVSAWATTKQVKPYRRWELQLKVIDAMASHGLAEQARECLEQVGSNVVGAVKLPVEVQISLLSQGAILWKRFGDQGKSQALIDAAEISITRQLEVIFQPFAYAELADTYAAIGDQVKARALYLQALDIAIELVNRRPRAIAGVDVCVSLTGHKEVMDADIQKKLERLNGTFDATQP